VRRAGVGDVEVFLVGEKAMPFGRTISVMTAVTAPDLASTDRRAAFDLLRGAIPFIVGVDAVGGSVNQIESSDFTTTHGRIERLPLHFSAMMEIEPSNSCGSRAA